MQSGGFFITEGREQEYSYFKIRKEVDNYLMPDSVCDQM